MVLCDCDVYDKKICNTDDAILLCIVAYLGSFHEFLTSGLYTILPFFTLNTTGSGTNNPSP